MMNRSLITLQQFFVGIKERLLIETYYMRPDGAKFYEVNVKVVNNTDDGYIYAIWDEIDENYHYVSFKNPEEILKKYRSF